MNKHTVHPGHREEPRLAEVMGAETRGKGVQALKPGENFGLLLRWEAIVRCLSRGAPGFR